MTDGAQNEPRPAHRRWLLFIIIALVTLAFAAGAIWWFFIKAHKLDVWKDATVPYSTGCADGGCKTVRKIAPAHGGEGGKGPAPELVYNPKIDDAVAQWGDCLQSIMSCVVKLKPDNHQGMKNCVAISICPKECKKRFASRAGSNMDEAEKAFYDVFTEPDAACRPEEP